jgi:3-phosphoglycerate kinase
VSQAAEGVYPFAPHACLQQFHLFATGGRRLLQLQDIDLKDKRVLIHTDFNVTFDVAAPKTVTKAARVQMLNAVPTIHHCLQRGAKTVILASTLEHQVFVPVQRDEYDQLSLEPLADALRSLIGQHVTFLDKCHGPDVAAYCNDPQTTGVILLEKLPLICQENRAFGVTDDTRMAFYASFAELADVFVNDNFSTADRCTGSWLGLGFAVRTPGFQITKEFDTFSQVIPFPSIHHHHPLCMHVWTVPRKKRTGWFDCVDEKSIASFD